MNNEQALQILKSVIDESIKKGVVPNMETAQQILLAFGIIANAIKTEEK